jgi:hypothetical protein
MFDVVLAATAALCTLGLLVRTARREAAVLSAVWGLVSVLHGSWWALALFAVLFTASVVLLARGWRAGAR